jgi:hypothetical protein
VFVVKNKKRAKTLPALEVENILAARFNRLNCWKELMKTPTRIFPKHQKVSLPASDALEKTSLFKIWSFEKQTPALARRRIVQSLVEDPQGF